MSSDQPQTSPTQEEVADTNNGSGETVPVSVIFSLFFYKTFEFMRFFLTVNSRN